MASKQTVLKICPPENSFVDVKTNIKCPIPDCDKTVFSSGSLRMHLSRSHGISETENDTSFHTRIKVKQNVLREFHCPSEECVYNIRSERHFSTMGQLKQHFMQVHAEKKYKCCKCSSAFGLERDLRRHTENCGIKFVCSTCQCTYISRESLLTHCQRKQHPVPEKYVRTKTAKKKEKEKNKSLSKFLQLQDMKIPVILLPVAVPISSNSVTSEQITAKVKSLGNRILLPSGKNKSCKDMSHLIDHDYQSNFNTYSNKPLLEKPCDAVSNIGTQTRDNGIYTEKGKLNYIESSIQTTLTLPLKKSRKTVAQTQTVGDHILKQAMASANIPIQCASVGTQVTPVDKFVDIQTQVTPKGKSRKRNCPDKKSLEIEHSRKNLYSKPAVSLASHDGLTSSKKKRRNKNHLKNEKISNALLSDDSLTAMTHQSSYSHHSFSQEDTGTERTFDCTQSSNLCNVMFNEKSQNDFTQNKVTWTDTELVSESMGHRNEQTIATSVDEFDFVNTIGVQTYSKEFQDFLLSGSDYCNSESFTSTIGINTDTSLQEKSTLLQNKCVGNDPPLSADSVSQTVTFDFLANSPDPQTDVMNTQTQTVDLDIESLESIVSSIQTQTASNYNSEMMSFNVQTQTKDSSSVNTQTAMTETTIDFNSFLSSSSQTQTYDHFPDFIELLSSGTQTLDYGLLQDTPLINMETQTGNSRLSFGTQTSMIENTSTCITGPIESNKEFTSSTYFGQGEKDSMNADCNSSQGQQFEFLVSEVLEMIPVETQTVEKNYPSPKISDENISNQTDLDRPTGGENSKNRDTSGDKCHCVLPQITNHSKNCHRYNEVLAADSFIQKNSRPIDDNRSQTDPNNCGVDNHTQTNPVAHNNHTQTIFSGQELTNSHTQTIPKDMFSGQELTNSHTQTILKDIDLTDSHTQTAWKELNDLLAELDH